MQRGSDGRRLNARQKLVGEAFARIFPERASFELRDEDVEAIRKQLNKGGPVNQTALQELHQRQDTAEWKAQHPCLLQNFPQFFERAGSKRIAVFLDYDGTLTPIVKDPDCAFMSQEMRQTVRSVACLFPTAIISGRGREKVQSFVQLEELFYAGSHGMDIVGPTSQRGESPMSFQAAERFAPIMDEIFADLRKRVKHIQGAAVEHNKFCVSVHFRNCESETAHEEVVEVVQTVLTSHPELRATRGRKVLEIRPEVEWDKGHALSYLLQSLSLANSSDVLPIYIGDDRTDEDAFKVLKADSKGVGILVSTKVKPTDATYRVRDPAEVRVFLERLVQWGRGNENAWHRDGSCKGWALNIELLTSLEPKLDAKCGKGSDPIAVSTRPPLHPASLLANEHSCSDLPSRVLDHNGLQEAKGNTVLKSVPIDSSHKLPASPFAPQT